MSEWSPRQVPTRSVIGLLILSVLMPADFAFGWKYGVEYRGARYTMILLVLNATAVTVAWTLVWFAKSRRRFESTLVAHAFIVAWLVWIAFPWLGELP